MLEASAAVPAACASIIGCQRLPKAHRLRSTEGRRYQTRIERLEQAGYLVPSGGTAPAGDTIEIVEVVDGNRARSRRLGSAGIYVRGFARPSLPRGGAAPGGLAPAGVITLNCRSANPVTDTNRS